MMALTFREAFDNLPSDGWLSEKEAELLWEWACNTNGDVLEVGCYMGRSTCLLASIGKRVFAVDPFDNFHSDLTGDQIVERFVKNLEDRCLINKVVIYRQKVEDWRARLVGLAYLDGDHTYEGTKAQIIKALECRPKTILVHDVNDSGGGLGVKRACLELLGPWESRVERLAVWQIRGNYV